MSESKKLIFNLDFKKIPVEIGGEEYVLVELDGRERDKYLNTLTGRLRTGADGKSQGVKNFEGLQSSLLSKSLRKIVDGMEVGVTEVTIQGWPARIQATLYDEARALSALGDEKKKKDADGNDVEDEEDEELEKNG